MWHCALFLALSCAIAVTPIPTVQLSNGVQVPLVAMGTGSSCKFNNTDAKIRVTMALQAGFSHIDTAYIYLNLPGVAQAIKNVTRSSLFLTSKVPGCTIGQPTDACVTATSSNLQSILSQLNTTYLDLLLLHYPPQGGCDQPSNCEKAKAQWKVLEDMYLTQKTVRAIGVSNYCQTCLECLEQTWRVAPMANQIEFHIGMGPDPKNVVSYCTDHKIVMEAYSPLAEGAVLQNFTVGDQLAKEYNVSSAQIALAWLAQRDHVVVTTSTNNTAHIVEDRDLWGFSLKSSDFASLDAITQPPADPCGENSIDQP